MHNEQGFTLLEFVLSVAIVGILTTISLPVLSRIQTKNDLDTAVSALVSSLRRAEILSRSVDGDTSWGVKAASGSVILFKGASFAARDTAYDEIFSVPTTITASGLTEIAINKFTGYPTATGSVTLVSSVAPADIATVTVNGKGMVEY